MAAILLQSNPRDEEQVAQPASRAERWYYGPEDGEPVAVGTLVGSLYLVRRTSEPAPNGDGTYWDLSWATSFGGGADPNTEKEDGSPSYTAEDDGIDVPLSRHPSYKANWDHDLIANFKFGETAPEVPEFWNTATTPELSSSDAQTFQWTKSDFPAHEYDENGDLVYWVRLKARQKPGIEVFTAPAMRVTEVKYYTSENDANLNIGATIGTHAAPAKLFGGPSGANKWLVTGMRSYPDGRRWAVQKVYQTAGYIDGAWRDWDEDLYQPES